MDLNKFKFSYNTRLIGIIENLMGFKPHVGYDVWGRFNQRNNSPF